MDKVISDKKIPHPHQLQDIEVIFDKIKYAPVNTRLLYQLPTGGGKTLVFSEIAKRFLTGANNRVAILTHRIELCNQTANALKKMGVDAYVITRTTKIKDGARCMVAMVETLRNRIKDKKLQVDDVGLVIVDEAHHNSFRKLLNRFSNAVILGVTATPFSSDLAVPMRKNYSELIAGKGIASLIEEGFLARPKTISYPVELNTLRKGIHGDFTVASSNELYITSAMQDLLLQAYLKDCRGKKTLIFNNGIETSLRVCEHFIAAGIAIRHLDNKTSEAERATILTWFKKTKSAVLTSVSILTTGFDEPTVQSVMLNRATTSITLYHQMIGRASRILPSKKTFQIIDLGNNVERFGAWEAPLDWNDVFMNPDKFAEEFHFASSSGGHTSNAITAEMRTHFPNTLELGFDIEGHYNDVVDSHLKPKRVIQQSLRQQALMCVENAESLSQALTLAELLAPEIQWRVKQYTACIGRATKNYRDWLEEDYKQRLSRYIQKLHHLLETRETSKIA